MLTGDAKPVFPSLDPSCFILDLEGAGFLVIRGFAMINGVSFTDGKHRVTGRILPDGRWELQPGEGGTGGFLLSSAGPSWLLWDWNSCPIQSGVLPLLTSWVSWRS